MSTHHTQANSDGPAPVDAVVIGAGFGGMYALHRLRDRLGLNAHAFEAGADA
ncbi:hypothetical protein GCM10027590_43450 [Nocardiopsis nanhaiensis]